MTTGAVRHAKLQSNHHHQQTPSFFTGRMPFLLPLHDVQGRLVVYFAKFGSCNYVYRKYGFACCLDRTQTNE